MTRVFSLLSKHYPFILSFGLLYGVFLWPLWGIERGFVRGDYGVQFYPWLYLYSDSLGQGQLPLWTPLIQCGFPLFAEGQTGMLYLPNLLLFKLLPFKMAYNAMFLAHFLASGVFMYLFARKRGMSAQAATVTALSFTFGSAYGGCFYNIVAMRTLVWFPAALYLLEKYFEKGKILPLLILALVQAQSWLAGFPQLAAYSTFFITVYFALRFGRERELSGRGRLRAWICFAASIASALLIALPQIWATLEWAGQSTRSLYGRGFAMWGSVPPWCFATLFMYSWGAFLKYKVYIGLWPAFAAILAGGDSRARIFWILTVISVFLALGWFNPLNWLLTYLPVAALFRNPSKFLFFTAFFLSMIAGFGYDRLSNISFRAAAALWAIITAGSWAVLLFARNAVSILSSYGEWYVRSFVIGKSFHQKSAHDYLQRIGNIVADVRRDLDPANPFFWVPIALASFFVGAYYLERVRGVRGLFKKAFIPLLLIDLFLFGQFGHGTGFVGNLGVFPDVSQQRALPADGRWLDLSREDQALFPPNRNLLTGHAQIGAYSPLLDREYYLLTKDFGALDDSFGRASLAGDALTTDRDLLDFLGVRYIATPIDQFLEGFREIAVLNGHRVYINDDALEEFVFAAPEGYSELKIVEVSPLSARVEVNSEFGGVVVRSQFYSKDWHVSVDGLPAKLERVGRAFQGVVIPQGGHRVEWLYKPTWFIVGRWFHFVGYALVLLAILTLAKRRT